MPLLITGIVVNVVESVPIRILYYDRAYSWRTISLKGECYEIFYLRFISSCVWPNWTPYYWVLLKAFMIFTRLQDLKYTVGRDEKYIWFLFKINLYNTISQLHNFCTVLKDLFLGSNLCKVTLVLFKQHNVTEICLKTSAIVKS